MPEPFQNAELQAYFSSLPASVQENLMQIAVPFHSVEELRAIAENLMRTG